MPEFALLFMKKGIFEWVCGILIIVGICYLSLVYYIEDNSKPLSDVANYKMYEIKSGNLTEICKTLEDIGIIKSRTAFYIKAQLSGISGRFKKGMYELSPSMNADGLIEILQSGGIKEEENSTVTVTIYEGSTIEDIADLLYEKKAIYNKDVFLDLCRSGDKFDIGFLSSDVKYAMEGYLFPDTYEFYINSSAESAINKMLDRFKEVYTDAYTAKMKEYGLSLNDVIALASIIEKEGKTKDFKKISSILHNRLDAGMYLQVDASVRYVENLSNTISITSSQYQSESPYNTYKHEGLPPSAICSPSKQAIEAVLYPDEEFINDGYLYFCLADYESGRMVFAKTYEEHLSNVKKYRDNWQAYDAAIE